MLSIDPSSMMINSQLGYVCEMTLSIAAAMYFDSFLAAMTTDSTSSDIKSDGSFISVFVTSQVSPVLGCFADLVIKPLHNTVLKCKAQQTHHG